MSKKPVKWKMNDNGNFEIETTPEEDQMDQFERFHSVIERLTGDEKFGDTLDFLIQNQQVKNWNDEED